MIYGIQWSDFAEYELQCIYEYYLEKAGKKVAKKIVSAILEKITILRGNAYLGQREGLLKVRQSIYRYLVIGHYKVVYNVDERVQIVKILDVFDTRQSSDKITRSLT